jgi:acetylornithine deacetylase/succinyl-diaminopimelate desuccinylase family protein
MPSHPAEAEVDAWLSAHRARLVETLAELVAFPTPSPPGRNTAAAQAYVRRRLEAAGCTVEQWDVHPGDPDVVGVLPGSGGGRSLLLNGHVDVAEVGDAAAWRRPPFRLEVEGDRAYGRGTADMKGGLAAGLLALEALSACRVRLRGTVTFESVVGEEQGEAGTAEACARGHRGDLAVVLDSSGLRVQGQGGVVTGWIVVQSPETFHDGLRRRMIHAGGGLRGASAIEKMCRLIGALGDLERHWAVTLQYPGFPPGTTTINPAVIEGGRHPAFVADRCALWITVHFYPDRTWQEVAAEVEAFVRRAAAADPWLAEHPPSFRWGGRSMLVDRGEVFPPVALDPAHPGVATLLAAHAEIAGREAEVGMSPTVSDGGWLAAAGMPTCIYGPGRLEQAHAQDEWVDLGDVLTAARTVARTALRWCDT